MNDYLVSLITLKSRIDFIQRSLDGFLLLQYFGNPRPHLLFLCFDVIRNHRLLRNVMFPLFPLLERQFTTGWNFDDDLFLHSP